MQRTVDNVCILLNIRTSVSLFDLHGFNAADKLGKIVLQEQANISQRNAHYTIKAKKFTI
jgi:hypothetical protein